MARSILSATVKRLGATTLTVLAVTGVAAHAVALGREGATSDSFSITVVVPPQAEPAISASFPPVVVQPLSPGVGDPPSAAAARSMQQMLVIDITGGTMSVSPATASITLRRTGHGHFAGRFGPITVVDARGTLVGWTLTARVASAPPGHLTVVPDPAVAVTGNPGEAVAAERSALTPAGTALMTAPNDGGGGDFAISGSIDLRGEADAGGDATTIALTFAVS